jgi:hypothetical protein
MNKKTDQQFDAADAAIKRAVTDLVSKIDQTSVRWEAVSHSYVFERALLALCAVMVKLIDDPDVGHCVGPAELKLSNALADYRDSRFEERCSPCLLEKLR